MCNFSFEVGLVWSEDQETLRVLLGLLAEKWMCTVILQHLFLRTSSCNMIVRNAMVSLKPLVKF